MNKEDLMQKCRENGFLGIPKEEITKDFLLELVRSGDYPEIPCQYMSREVMLEQQISICPEQYLPPRDFLQTMSEKDLYLEFFQVDHDDMFRVSVIDPNGESSIAITDIPATADTDVLVNNLQKICDGLAIEGAEEEYQACKGFLEAWSGQNNGNTPMP